MRRLCVLVLALGALGVVPASPLGGACTRAARAASPHAALVIQFSDTDVREFCVELDGSSTDGFAMVQRTGLPLAAQDFGGGAITICLIDGVGCDHPTEPCFCACADPASGCTFWGAYRVRDGAWRFSDVGLTEMRVRDGDVIGLRWGVQEPTGGNPPRPQDVTGVCARGMPVALHTVAVDRLDGPAPLWSVTVGAAIALVLIAAFLAARKRRREGPA